MPLSSFDPQRAFLEVFEDELRQHPPDAEWATAGRPSKANPHGEDAEWWKANGPEMVKRWMTWRDNNPLWQLWVSPDGVLGVELEVALDLAGESFKLVIDRVFATAPDNARPVVVDLKSGARNPEDADVQIGLYKVAVEQMWPGVRVAGAAYWNARTGKLDEVASLSHFTPEYMAALAKRLKNIRRAGAYLPSPGSQCRSCSVGRFCAINNGKDSHLDPDFVLLGGKA